MNKKYKLTREHECIFNHVVYRIKALRDFSDVKKGDLGGFIRSENNLSHDGDCWIYDDAMAYDNARVYDNAKLYDYVNIRGNAKIYGDAKISDYAWISGDPQICGNAHIFGIANVNESIILNSGIWTGRAATINNNNIKYLLSSTLQIVILGAHHPTKL